MNVCRLAEIAPLTAFFREYDAKQAPFMHQQWTDWQRTQPLLGLRVLHHVPVVPNTLLKIACLVAAGAEVSVTNPSFMSAHPRAIDALRAARIPFHPEVTALNARDFDIFFDCGAELYQALGAPRLGIVELTASGDHYFREKNLDFPVVSIDPTYTKQLETIFGTAVSAQTALQQLTGVNVAEKAWAIFGFGKIGRGLGYYCQQQHAQATILDIDPIARSAAHSLQLAAYDANDHVMVKNILEQADIVVTATGKTAALAAYPKTWFEGKILANMGMLDEYGPAFSTHDVLNQKQPLNFILDDPTPVLFIDPEFYAHNIAALELLAAQEYKGVLTLSAKEDAYIIQTWCQSHGYHHDDLLKWMVAR